MTWWRDVALLYSASDTSDSSNVIDHLYGAWYYTVAESLPAVV